MLNGGIALSGHAPNLAGSVGSKCRYLRGCGLGDLAPCKRSHYTSLVLVVGNILVVARDLHGRVLMGYGANEGVQRLLSLHLDEEAVHSACDLRHLLGVERALFDQPLPGRFAYCVGLEGTDDVHLVELVIDALHGRIANHWAIRHRVVIERHDGRSGRVVIGPERNLGVFQKAVWNRRRPPLNRVLYIVVHLNDLDVPEVLRDRAGIRPLGLPSVLARLNGSLEIGAPCFRLVVQVPKALFRIREWHPVDMGAIALQRPPGRIPVYDDFPGSQRNWNYLLVDVIALVRAQL